jgi:hypothetical protein
MRGQKLGLKRTEGSSDDFTGLDVVEESVEE